MTVWSFSLEKPNDSGRCFLWLPEDATILSWGVQDSEIVAWAMVPDLNATFVYRPFLAVNTGMEIEIAEDEQISWEATLDVSRGVGRGVVWHIFSLEKSDG